MSSRPACGANVCITPSNCSKCCNVCKLPTGPTVNSSADMMASAVLSRTTSGMFPRLEIGLKGVKLTRPGYYDVNRGDAYMAWANKTYCCT